MAAVIGGEPLERDGGAVERRVALVTGGARGIGRAAAELLLDRGFAVLVSDVDPTSVEEADAELAERYGGAGRAVVGSVTEGPGIERVLAAVAERHARLDVLVNNAGITGQAPIQAISDAAWNRLIDVHLGGTFRMCRSALSLLRASPAPAVVNMSSVVATRGLPGRTSYTAAKAAIEGITRALAVEWATHGIRVNAVAPGWTRTRMFDDTVAQGLVDAEAMEQVVPLGRLAERRDVAEAIAFLASDRAAYITGQTLVVDGGLSIRFPF